MGRKIITSHRGLASLAGEQIVLNRFTTLADAVRVHEERMSSAAVEQRPQDEALYGRLRRVGG